MPTKLKLVATPLGHVGDISRRAIEEITQADAIFAEDTRHSRKLFAALSLTLKPNCRLISCDAHKEKQRIDMVIEKLCADENVLYISDAGCPAISDPGSILVAGIIKHGLEVEVIPGPSAHSAALMGAGLDTTRFAFLGFLPQKKSQRQKIVQGAASAGLALVIYESSLRMRALLDDLVWILGERRVVVAREISKFYETFHRGTLGHELTPPFVEKGECVVVIEAQAIKKITGSIDDQRDELTNFISQKLAEGCSRKEIASMAAEIFTVKKQSVYQFMNEL